MEITEKVSKVMPLQEGTSTKTGDKWYSQELILITDERYPKEIAFTFKNANTQKLKDLKKGDKVTVTFDAESRESKGRYFTTLFAWKIDIIEKNENGEPAIITPVPEPEQPSGE